MPTPPPGRAAQPKLSVVPRHAVKSGRQHAPAVKSPLTGSFLHERPHDSFTSASDFNANTKGPGPRLHPVPPPAPLFSEPTLAPPSSLSPSALSLSYLPALPRAHFDETDDITPLSLHSAPLPGQTDQAPFLDLLCPFPPSLQSSRPLPAPFQAQDNTITTTPSVPSAALVAIESDIDLIMSLFETPLQVDSSLPVFEPFALASNDFADAFDHLQGHRQLLSPTLQSPLRGMMGSQQTPHRGPSGEQEEAAKMQAQTPAENTRQVPSQSSEQQQGGVDAAQMGGEAGGKIWDLFPAITPQMQTHHQLTTSPPDATASAHQPTEEQHYQQQLQHQHLTHAMYQQQQHLHQQDPYASWAQYGQYDAAALAHAHIHSQAQAPADLPTHLGGTPDNVLPGARLGESIQQLLPSQTPDEHGVSNALGAHDLMSLFVPSLMLPGYPRQVPVSESFLALSPTGSESSMSGKKGGAFNKGGVSANSTPRMMPAQLHGQASVPPPAQSMVSVPVPRQSTWPLSVDAHAEGDRQQETRPVAQQFHAEPQEHVEQSAMDAGLEAGQNAGDGKAGAALNHWDGANIGIGVGVGAGLGNGISEQTSWQTLPDGALDFAQPSSFRAVFDMSAFPSLHSASGAPITPFTGAEWLDWPETPLKTALKSASASGTATLSASSGSSVGVEVSAEKAQVEQHAESGTAGEPNESHAGNGHSAPPQSARFVSIPLYTVPGSATEGSTAEPTLALPPGVPIPTNAPMTGWIFDTADVGPEGVKGVKRKRGDRGRPRCTFSTDRPILSPSTPGSGLPVTSAHALREAVGGLLSKTIAEAISIVDRCSEDLLPAEPTAALRGVIAQDSPQAALPSADRLKLILEQLTRAVELLPPTSSDPSGAQGSHQSHKTLDKPLAVRTDSQPAAHAMATATTTHSAPSARVPWDELNMPMTSTYAFEFPFSHRPMETGSAPATALPRSAVSSTSSRPALQSANSMPPPSSAGVLSPPPTGMSGMSVLSGISDRSASSKRFTGAWSAEEVARLTKVAESNKMCLSSGETVVDWKVAIEQFGDTRSKHQILVKAVELGLKGTTTSTNRRKRQRKHKDAGAGPRSDGKTSPTGEQARGSRSWSANDLDGDGIMF